MDSGVLVAIIAGAATIGAGVGGAVAGPLAAHLTGRRLRDAQTEHLRAQAEQARQAAEQLRQDVYQGLTADLRAEIDRVRGQLRTAHESLTLTSAEAERLRRRVTELESRVAQLETTGRHLVDELAQARAQLAEKDTLITTLQARVASLQRDLAAATAQLAGR